MSGTHRFFIRPEQISDGKALISGSQARQICDVLRLKTGDPISVLDGSGRCYVARIGSANRHEVAAEITDSSLVNTEATVKLTLAQALAKGDKVEMVVQKATELGTSDIVLFTSERTIPKPAKDRMANKLARWETIAREAAEQSCRAVIPKVTGVIGFDELLGRASGFDPALVAWENEGGALLRDALARLARADARILFIVGPEGGFAEREILAAEEAGVVPVSLGKRILRTETAAIAGCAIILHSVDESGSRGRNSAGNTPR